ncbi:MerR family transcriptional regulator, partial [Burkholderia cenocepacia]|nr:MerR family transcriptional regulator [Burkholderia cenocepacia]
SLSISEVTRQFGIRASALRYYEEIGLLTPASRYSGRRHYGTSELKRLVLIQLLQDAGQLSLSEIADVLGHDSEDVTRAVLKSRISVLERQIKEARAAKRYLEHRLTCPREDPVNKCPVLDKEVSQWLDARLHDSTARHQLPPTPHNYKDHPSVCCKQKLATQSNDVDQT